MRKIYLLLITILLFSTSSKASHYLGGEIGWTCLSNGRYVFHMKVSRDCSGISVTFQNEYINVVSASTPGTSVILLKPDSVRWVASGFGDNSPECTSQYGASYSCSNNNLGSIQEFYYQSDPIALTGFPHPAGINFNWLAPCCRSNSIDNLLVSSNSRQLLLSATMYPNASNSSVYVCYDSSPKFTDLPTLFVCRGQELNYNHFVTDEDGDSLVYSWGTPYDGPASSPQPISFVSPYSNTNPTPGTSIDSLNIASSLNINNGSVRFRVNSGSNINRYSKVLNVASWRDGVKIAEVNREYLYTVLDCPNLPSGQVNESPKFSLNITKDSDGVYRDTVMAGSNINYLISLQDTVSTGIGTGQQKVTLIPFGDAFSLDFADSSNCRNLSDTSCAFLNPPPMLNSGATPPNLELSGFHSISTHFNWLTNCNHLSAVGTSKTHYFSFKYFDDHCPIPGANYTDLEITVIPNPQTCNTVTSIAKNSNESKGEPKVYPNPTNGKLFINFNKTYRNLNLIVRNIHGQVVQQNNYFNQNSIELEIGGEAGIYFIEVVNEQGEKANLKVVKQ